MPVHPKIVIFDIETTNLEANRGHILCAAAKWIDQEQVLTWRIDDTPGYGKTPASWHDDSAIVAPLVALLDSADAVVAYYGGYNKFDVPYLNTRALANKLKPANTLTVIDPYVTARSRLKLARNSLDAVSTLLGTKRRKQHVPWDDWLAARYGDRKAMDKLLEYNVCDVLTLEDTYKGLRPLMPDHPYVAVQVPGLDYRHQCPACGSGNTRADGSRTTKVYRVFRRRCNNCGSSYIGGKTKNVQG